MFRHAFLQVGVPRVHPGQTPYTALPCTLCADAESVLGFVLLATFLQAGEITTLVLEREDTESAVNFQSLE